MSREKDDTAYQALEIIRMSHNGILRAVDVVEAAMSEDNPLHDRFEWDDTKAGYEYRIWQARQLIRYVVITVPKYKKPIIAYVSLKGDRHEEGGGYRAIVDVLSDKVQREILLREALQDLAVWQAKYEELTELVPIFRNIERYRAREAKKAETVKPVTKRKSQPVPA